MANRILKIGKRIWKRGIRFFNLENKVADPTFLMDSMNMFA